MEGYKYVVYYVEFSFDGKYVVIVLGGIRLIGFLVILDRSVWLWDVEIGWEFVVLEYFEDLVIYVGFSLDGKYIVIIGVCSVCLWDV